MPLGPRYTPSLALAFYFGMVLFAASEENRAKTGQSNMCVCLSKELTTTPANFSNCHWLLHGEGSMSQWHMDGPRPSGLGMKRIALACSCRSQMAFSARTF